MQIKSAAIAYCTKHNVSRAVVFSANRFAKFCGDKDVSQITREDIEQFAARAKESGLAAETVKTTVKDIRTVILAAGLAIETVPIKVPAPDPIPTSHEDLNAIWPHLEFWEKQHLALTFHCCFRVGDIVKLQVEGVPVDTKAIRLTAQKTGRRHAVPVPDWLRQYLGATELPFSVASRWSHVVVRDRLAKACEVAKLDQIYPHNVRQTGINAWAQSNGMAGAIIHGCGLTGSVLKHYVSPIQVLESAMHRVVVPAAMRGACQVTGEEELLSHFRRLDAESQKTVTSVAERFVH